jgi:hypothetical protein
VTSIAGTLLFAISHAVIKKCVSRDIPAPGNPVSTGSIADDFRALGALKVTAAIAIVSLGSMMLRLPHRSVNMKPSQKFFVMRNCASQQNCRLAAKSCAGRPYDFIDAACCD